MCRKEKKSWDRGMKRVQLGAPPVFVGFSQDGSDSSLSPNAEGALQGQGLMQKKKNQLSFDLSHSHQIYLGSAQWKRLFLSY